MILARGEGEHYRQLSETALETVFHFSSADRTKPLSGSDYDEDRNAWNEFVQAEVLPRIGPMGAEVIMALSSIPLLSR
jgi:hypothetical protein